MDNYRHLLSTRKTCKMGRLATIFTLLINQKTPQTNDSDTQSLTPEVETQNYYDSPNIQSNASHLIRKNHPQSQIVADIYNSHICETILTELPDNKQIPDLEIQTDDLTSDTDSIITYDSYLDMEEKQELTDLVLKNDEIIPDTVNTKLTLAPDSSPELKQAHYTPNKMTSSRKNVADKIKSKLKCFKKLGKNFTSFTSNKKTHETATAYSNIIVDNTFTSAPDKNNDTNDLHELKLDKTKNFLQETMTPLNTDTNEAINNSQELQIPQPETTCDTHNDSPSPKILE